MAELKASLQELVECPICYEIFVEPRALPCLHTLCDSCLQQVTTWPSIVKCPFCNKAYKTREAKVDFRTQQLVDLYMTLDRDIGFQNLSNSANSSGDSLRSSVSGQSQNDIKEVQLAQQFKLTPPDNTRITSMSVHRDTYYFVLNTGNFLLHKPSRNNTKCISVQQKKNLGKGVLGGAIAGLVASPFGPVAAVAAAVSTFALSSNILGSSPVTSRYKVELLTHGQQGRLVALCESRHPREEDKQVLLELNENGTIESTLGPCNHQVVRLQSNQDGSTVYDTFSRGRNVTAWSRQRDGSWLAHSIQSIRHMDQVQITVDDRHCYTLDDQSVYKANRSASQLISAHNLPAPYAGRLSLLGASKGSVLLWNTYTKAICTLNTVNNSWTRVHVPDDTCKPVHAILTHDLHVHVLCSRTRGGECTIYSRKL